MMIRVEEELLSLMHTRHHAASLHASELATFDISFAARLADLPISNEVFSLSLPRGPIEADFGCAFLSTLARASLFITFRALRL
jgi:hypothetical protein